ncbi:CLUMA_CG019429, isoform A [Clunio marinus]|uniref:CLUMA_CG019429, isoform A n=1 Tax=Clunio marinus TaxID=568069 RepID=A0A1J1J2P4_9DIPT|nr:CLUMA_CG019429, isoform A [Clunio marinus]
MEESIDDPVILQISLIGFHHKKGWIQEFSYPEICAIDIDMEHLPTLCLPDQSHNFESDSVYFILPNKDSANDSKKVFGVSCFRQIPIEKLTNRSENDEFSRSSVQKSVCCLSRLPLFGYIEVKLNIIVDKIFEHGMFDCSEFLRESYNELNRCLTLRMLKSPENSNGNEFLNDFFIETCLRELILLWRHKILLLFKLLLIEKRVLFFGSPVKPVCATILSIISLHPQLLSDGLCNDFGSKDLTFEQSECEEFDVKTTPVIDKTPDSDKSDDIDCVKQITILPTIPPAEYLAPLQIFRNGFLCLPFISLHYFDVLTDKSHNGFIVGASNVLFQQKKNLVDVMIDVTNQTIDFIDLDIKKCLALTTEDLRFYDHVIKGIENPRADGYGTDSWIREQFESYFTSMLRTAYDSENRQDWECFNEHFMEVWVRSNNYQDWLAKKITSTSSGSGVSAFDTFPRGHPFARRNNARNVSDFKNKIVQSINNTQSARKINQAVNNTFSNAKTTFSSWLSNFSHQKDETANKDMMNMESRDKIENIDLTFDTLHK